MHDAEVWTLIGLLAAALLALVGQNRRLSDRVNDGFLGLTREMAELRTDLRGEMAELRTDLRGEMADLRGELKAEIAGLRQDLREHIDRGH